MTISAERPVRHTFAVRERTPHEDARAFDAVEELPRQPALPHTGLAVDREEVCALIPERAVERVLEQLELGLASDEGHPRDERPPTPVENVDHTPCAQRPVDALELERARVLDHEAACRETVRRRPDEDLVRTRRRLKAGGEVHGLPRRERRIVVLDDHLTGLDPDPCLEPEGLEGFANRERRTSRALRVVLVGLRNAERGHDRVAGELLDDPAVLPDGLGNRLEELVHAPTHDLGVGRGDEPGRVDDVDEQDRCELPLHV